jgi:hypothetical protein
MSTGTLTLGFSLNVETMHGQVCDFFFQEFDGTRQLTAIMRTDVYRLKKTALADTVKGKQ